MPTGKPEPSAHPLEDHPDYTKAIGMISLEAVAIEIRMALLLARMLAIPIKTAQAIYLTPKAEQTRLDIIRNVAHAALAPKLSQVKSALGKQKSKALKDVNELIDRALSLIRERHRVIHDEWNYSDKEQKVTRRLIDGRPNRERIPIDKAELERLIHEMRTLIDDIYDLSLSFRENPPFMADLRGDSTNSST